MSIEKQKRYLSDIIFNADKIALYIEGINQKTFESDEKTIDAVERCLQRITEVAIRLKDQADEWLPNHDWAGIRSLGNHLRHQYDAIHKPVIWQIITLDLPALRHDCAALLVRLQATDTAQE